MNPLLWQLQETENHLAALAREKTRLNDGTHARATRDTLQTAVQTEAGRGQKIGSERLAKELELKTAEEKLARQHSRMMNASSAHEISALQRDIEALGHARGDLDETILTMMDEGESCANGLADLEKQLAQSKAEATRIETQFTAETNRINAELEKAQTEREKITAQLSDAERAKFDSVAQRHNGIAVAHVENGNCSACGSAILPGNLREAKTEEFPTCENCGRLLFAN